MDLKMEGYPSMLKDIPEGDPRSLANLGSRGGQMFIQKEKSYYS